MRETKIYCDHCGKVLDPMKDFDDQEFDVISWFKADLCISCADELNIIVLKYCGKEIKTDAREAD